LVADEAEASDEQSRENPDEHGGHARNLRAAAHAENSDAFQGLPCGTRNRSRRKRREIRTSRGRLTLGAESNRLP
jgi:hypothetical protein